MSKDTLMEFYSSIYSFDDYDYLISILRFNMAPVIHKKKIGGLITLYNNKRNLKDLRTKHKQQINKILGFDFFELKETQNSILILFYIDKKLKKRLKQNNIKNFLDNLGYKNCNTTYDYFKVLRSKLSVTCPFEIGVFLGYPLTDIISFNKGTRNYKCVGYWKCFNNKDKALRTFLNYDNSKLTEMQNILKAV